ncbi:hypothetical protein PQQ51_04780 [Paraburkholderia xenovorans]|uniref:hypothetical protein n=1 Tax=Paraburkholderia xenovorans TaxID=36873 RepID=UPI0038BC9AEF
MSESIYSLSIVRADFVNWLTKTVNRARSGPLVLLIFCAKRRAMSRNPRLAGIFSRWKMTLLKPAKFAELCEVSRQAVTKWRQAGRLVMQGELVDVEATHERMRKNQKGGSPLDGKLVAGIALGEFAPEVRTARPASETPVVPSLLRALDGTQVFDFSRAGLQKRVTDAARILGFEPVFDGDDIDLRRGGESHFLCDGGTFDENAYCALDMLRWWLGGGADVPSALMPALPLLARPFGTPVTFSLCENCALP